jgi:hypothetical protein
MPVGPVPSPKRRKVQKTMLEPLSECPPVLLVNKSELEVKPIPATDVTKLKSCAVLPDWRERFENASRIDSSSSLEVQPLVGRKLEVKDDENEEPSGLSIDVLRKALQHNLSALGLDVANIKEEKLLQLVERMMSGQDLDDLLDELVEEVHDQDGEEEGDSFSKWVSSKVNTSNSVQSSPQHHAAVEAKENRKADSFIEEHPSPALPSSPDQQGSKYNSSRGAKRKADSPSISPRKKTNRPRDQLSAKG